VTTDNGQEADPSKEMTAAEIIAAETAEVDDDKKPSAEPVRVLIVDDSLTIRAMLSQIIDQDEHFRLVGAVASADEARSRLAFNPPDVMLLDLVMPGKGGLEFLSEVMATEPLPIVIASSQVNYAGKMHDEVLRRGAVACVPKGSITRDTPGFLKTLRQAAKRKVKAKPLPE